MKPTTIFLSTIVFTTLILSCNPVIKTNEKAGIENKEGKSDTTLQRGNNFNLFTRIKLTVGDSIMDNMSRKDASIYMARKYYNEITDIKFIDFLSADYKSTTIIEGYGKVALSEINIRGKDISTVTPKRCFLLYSKEKREVFFLNFNQFFLLKRKVNDTESIIGGVVITKGVGYFLAYSFKDSSFIKVFDSGFDIEDNIIAVPVYLNDGECIKYANNYLSFKNIDINNDGFLDLSFSGTVVYYCKPNEYGIDISKREPVKREKIKINYVLKKYRSKLTWVLSDTIQIKKLLDIK